MISSLHIQRITVLVSHWSEAQLVLNLISVGGCHWSKYSTFTLSDAWPGQPGQTGEGETLVMASASSGLSTFVSEHVLGLIVVHSYWSTSTKIKLYTLHLHIPGQSVHVLVWM